MNENLAIEIAKCKMRELGYGQNYTLRVRHLLLQEAQTRILKVGNNLLILYNPVSFTRVSSKMGVFDVTFPKSDEMQYVHSGNVTLTNLNEGLPTAFTLLQVIPLNQ